MGVFQNHVLQQRGMFFRPCTLDGALDLRVDVEMCYHQRRFAYLSSNSVGCVFRILLGGTYFQGGGPFGNGIPPWLRGSQHSFPIAVTDHLSLMLLAHSL